LTTIISVFKNIHEHGMAQRDTMDSLLSTKSWTRNRTCKLKALLSGWCSQIVFRKNLLKSN